MAQQQLLHQSTRVDGLPVSLLALDPGAQPRRQPDDLFGARRPAKRRGDQDLGEGPGWRIVYWTPKASRPEIRLVVILAVAAGHPKPPDPNAYELATRRLEPLLDAFRKKGESK